MLRAFLNLMCVCAFLLSGSIAHAQFTTPPLGTIQLFVTPQYPSPGEKVTVRAENYSININATELTWSLDGKVQKKGVGEKVFEFIAGPLGSVSTVNVSGGTVSGGVKIRPTTLDIVWQTNTYIPPLYQGKALYTTQSDIEFVALPQFVGANGKVIDPNTLIYKWTRNGSVLNNSSGYGKRVLNTNGGTLLKPITIDLEVSTTDGSIVSKKSIEVAGVQPKIVLYENHPLYGITYRKSIPDTFTLTSKEIIVVASPYYFDISGVRDADINYVWKMNGATVANQELPSSLTLRTPEEGGGGKANISLKMSHGEKITQFAETALGITFNTSVTEQNQ